MLLSLATDVVRPGHLQGAAERWRLCPRIVAVHVETPKTHGNLDDGKVRFCGRNSARPHTFDDPMANVAAPVAATAAAIAAASAAVAPISGAAVPAPAEEWTVTASVCEVEVVVVLVAATLALVSASVS